MTPKERAAMQQALEALEAGGNWYVRQQIAITALREALEQPDEIDWIETNKALAREIIELQKQAEQEPVAWIDLTEQDKWSAYCDHMPPTKNRKLVFDAGISAGIKFFKEKNAAPIRTKELTDDEIDALVDSACDSQMPMDMFARAVIAADREKNK